MVASSGEQALLRLLIGFFFGLGDWRRLVFIFLVVALLLFRMIIVDRILSLRTLQLDRDLHLRLADLVIIAERLEALRQHLHSQRSVRNPIEAGLPFRIGLELKSGVCLLSLITY